jgi:hypothetical protein
MEPAQRGLDADLQEASRDVSFKKMDPPGRLSLLNKTLENTKQLDRIIGPILTT